MHLILTSTDLPLAELSAMRLDGELVAVDRWYAPFDDFPTERQRAAALFDGLPDRLIAERRTAAWVWGAVDTPPAPHEFCTAHDARVTRRPTPHVVIREVVLGPADTVTISGLAVTTPQRTAADLLRFTESWSPRDRETTRRLLSIGSVCEQDVLDELSRHKLPHKRRAVERLRECVSPN
ncbi:hypothetical protein HDC94_001944 [Leifsonia sp. AK011]|uniref:hypothetical protein n=1 Tax=Leifsonia sp. AK011 TaxID=2723075 RepID=UPI0015CE898A|nr:hypothetical protein [Leifsonia sp. AK011]NYF10788.1 hypothetical protein [Leifsonia sp. AK011]